MRPPDDPEIGAWLSKAADDLRAADILFESDPGLEGIICFPPHLSSTRETSSIV